MYFLHPGKPLVFLNGENYKFQTLFEVIFTNILCNQVRKDSPQAPKTAIKAIVKLGNNVFFSLDPNLMLTLCGYNVFHQEPVP